MSLLGNKCFDLAYKSHVESSELSLISKAISNCFPHKVIVRRWSAIAKQGRACKMMVLVTYDVSTLDRAGQRRLQKVAKTCQNFGQRVQQSVFECSVTMEQFIRLKAELQNVIDPTTDSLRFYFLGNNWHHRVEHYGANPVTAMDDPLII
jgi:CRISPR-associated protein Cas2